MIIGADGAVWAILHPPRMIWERWAGERYDFHLEVVDVARLSSFGSHKIDTTYYTADVQFVCPD